MVRVDGKNLVQRTTKTASGKRTIPLNSRALEAVHNLKAQQLPGCTYVFATQTGKYLSYRNLLVMMDKACVARAWNTGACTRSGTPSPATCTRMEW